MKYISLREFYYRVRKELLNEAGTPLSYVSILKRVKEHIGRGNEAEIISIGEGNNVRYAVPVAKTNQLLKAIK